MSRYAFIMLNLLLGLAVSGMIPAAAIAQQISTQDKVDEQLFLLKVKSVNEFIERFNDDQNTLLRRELRKQKQPVSLNRHQMVKHLFDHEKEDWDTSLVRSFLDVFDTGRRYQLDLLDTNWIAVTKCRFLLDGVERIISLQLKLMTTEDSGVHWMICGLTNDTTLPLLPQDYTATVSCNPHFIRNSSHATYFLAFRNAFRDLNHLPEYFSPGFLASGRPNEFIHALAIKKMTFSSLADICYYFFQVDDWVFQVSEVNRISVNNGWLITALYKVPNEEKADFMKRIY